MLILVAHGSRNPDWRASVEGMVDSLTAELGAGIVALAYMDCSPPTLMDVAASAVKSGASRIIVLPLFLASQGHVDRDVVPLVDEVREVFPDVSVEMLPPMGQHPSFISMLRTIALGE